MKKLKPQKLKEITKSFLDTLFEHDKDPVFWEEMRNFLWMCAASKDIREKFKEFYTKEISETFQSYVDNP